MGAVPSLEREGAPGLQAILVNCIVGLPWRSGLCQWHQALTRTLTSLALPSYRAQIIDQPHEPQAC